MGIKEISLKAGDVVEGKTSQIRFAGTTVFTSKGKRYQKLSGERVLRFGGMGKGRGRVIQLFQEPLAFLVAMIARGRSARSDLREALFARYRPTHPRITEFDYDYINVALHLCPDFQNADLPDDAPSGVALRRVLVRQGQQAFRRRVLLAYGARCLISGCEVASLIDAAHIVSFAKSKSNKVANGLPLRTDLHTLFDLGLLRLKPTTGGKVRVDLAASVQADRTYAKLDGKTITLPDAVRDIVLENLRARYAKST